MLSGNVPGTVRAYVMVMREAQPAAGPVPVTMEVAARRFGVVSSAAAVVLVVLAVDLDAVQADLAGVVHQALEAAHVSVWMSQRD